MTRVELIKSIGEALRNLDHLRTRRPADDSISRKLNELRNTLARQQLTLAINDFDEDAAAFFEATREIEMLSAELAAATSRPDPDNIRIDTLERLVRAVDSVVNIAIPF